MIIRIPLHGIKLIDFSGIFKKHIETELVNQLDEFKLIKDGVINIRNKHVKRLSYHYIIKGLCDYVLSVKSRDKILIVYSTTHMTRGDLACYTDGDDLQQFFNKLINKISKMLPIKFMHIDNTFAQIRTNVRKNNGDCADIVNNAKHILDSFDISVYTFTKARNFAKRYELTYLSNNFFQQIKNKQLIMC
jgi:hypothetical protein